MVTERPIKALLDPYNPTGSTRHVRFNTSRTDRWETNGPPPKNHINWVVLDSDWEVGDGRPRRYYRLSRQGRNSLAELTTEWEELVETLGRLLAEN